MTPTEASKTAAGTPQVANSMDMKLEVVGVPVSDMERAKEFYHRLGWRLDADRIRDGGRIVQFTPRGSPCSVHLSQDVSSAAPGSAQGLYLIVSDIAAARTELLGRGIAVSEIFHRTNGEGHFSGPDPGRHSYASLFSFSDPDGNGWVLQEVTSRLPGRVNSDVTAFASAMDLASALRRAAAAHGEHERRTGQPDPEWPTWYANYLAHEQAGELLPS